METNPQVERALRAKLPIDDDEKIIAIYKHHWFAYFSSWLFSIVLILVVVALVVLLLGSQDAVPAQYRQAVLLGGILLSVIVFGASILPAYLMSQEHLVLTDEAVFQILQPSLLASKVDQLGLGDVGNVSVRQDALGTIFGYGHLMIETPGEQDNYQFRIVAEPQRIAREIAQESEDFDAAMQAGMISSKRTQEARSRYEEQSPTMQIDPQEYKDFLAFQEMKRTHAASGENDGAQPRPSEDATSDSKQA